MLTKEQKEFLEANRKIFESLIPLKKELEREEDDIVIERGKIIKKPVNKKNEAEKKKKRIIEMLDKMTNDEIDKFLSEKKE